MERLNEYPKIRFGVIRGMRGFFAIMYDDGGPINSGTGSYANSKEAAMEAYEWAIAENFPLEAARLVKEYNLTIN